MWGTSIVGNELGKIQYQNNYKEKITQSTKLSIHLKIYSMLGEIRLPFFSSLMVYSRYSAALL
jgi:hypothetical protein